MEQTRPTAFLVVRMVVEPDFEDEFNRWYNEEHYPERMSVPGFLRGTRMVSHGDDGTSYMAVYELTDADVLTSPEYLAIGAKENASPWTLEVVPHLVSMDRRIYTNITPALAQRS
jgi:hypothetical protein